MFSVIQSFVKKLTQLFEENRRVTEPLSEASRGFLSAQVSFYQQLSNDDKARFERRCLAFISNTEFDGYQCEVSEEDKLLVAAASVILAWGFDNWHYVKLGKAILVPHAFNYNLDSKKADSHFLGMVGNNKLAATMILSQSALHYGFSNNRR